MGGIKFLKEYSYKNQKRELSAAGSAEYKEKYVQLKEYRVKTQVLS